MRFWWCYWKWLHLVLILNLLPFFPWALCSQPQITKQCMVLVNKVLLRRLNLLIHIFTVYVYVFSVCIALVTNTSCKDCSFGFCILAFVFMVTCWIMKISWAVTDSMAWESESAWLEKKNIIIVPSPPYCPLGPLGKLPDICLAQSRYSINVHAFLFVKKEELSSDAEVWFYLISWDIAAEPSWKPLPYPSYFPNVTQPFLFLLGQSLPFHFSRYIDLFSELEMVIGMEAAKTRKWVCGKQFIWHGIKHKPNHETSNSIASVNNGNNRWLLVIVWGNLYCLE